MPGPIRPAARQMMPAYSASIRASSTADTHAPTNDAATTPANPTVGAATTMPTSDTAVPTANRTVTGRVLPWPNSVWVNSHTTMVAIVTTDSVRIATPMPGTVMPSHASAT